MKLITKILIILLSFWPVHTIKYVQKIIYPMKMRPNEVADKSFPVPNRKACVYSCVLEKDFSCFMSLYDKGTNVCQLYEHMRRDQLTFAYGISSHEIWISDKINILVYCPDGYTYLPNVNTCLKYISQQQTQPNALNLCRNDGAHLPVAMTTQFNEALTNFTKRVPFDWVWLALQYNSYSSRLLWIRCTDSAIPLNFTNWVAAPSNLNYVYLYTYQAVNRSTWRNTASTDTNLVVCQYDPIPLKARCPSGYHYMANANTCFIYSGSFGSYTTAVSKCTGYRTHLPVIYNEVLNQALLDFSSCFSLSWFWLSLELVSGSTYTWKQYGTSQIASYVNFVSGYPGGKPYVYMKLYSQSNADVGKWIDTIDTDSCYIACQYDPEI